jgi:hypothetical protein
MILYHFTALQTVVGEAFGEPWAEGEEARECPIALTELAPASNDYPEMPPVVWLTTNPDPGGERCACCIARLRLTIPSADRRLYPYKKFMKRLAGKRGWNVEEMFQGVPPKFLKAVSRDWWCYQGTIPLDRCQTGGEIIRDQMVFWGAIGGYAIGDSKEVNLAAWC